MNSVKSIEWCVNVYIKIKSSRNFAYISNISTYKQFLKSQKPILQQYQISLKSVNNCGRSSIS